MIVVFAAVGEIRLDDCFAGDDDQIVSNGGRGFIPVATIAAFGREHRSKGRAWCIAITSLRVELQGQQGSQ